MSDDLELSVVIAAYNEASRLPASLEKIADYLKRRGLSFEILIVDDGSRDSTAESAIGAAKKCGLASSLRVLQNRPNRGKGYSIRRGMLESKGRLALFSDADLSAPIEELEWLLEALKRGRLAIAFGSRGLKESQIEIRQSWFREHSGKAFNLLVRALTGLSFHDTQCGFKLFDMDSCRSIFERQRIERFGFDVEVLYIARKWGLPMQEIPVVWSHAEGSTVRFFPDALHMFRDLLKIRWNDLRGHYTHSRPGAEYL